MLARLLIATAVLVAIQASVHVVQTRFGLPDNMAEFRHDLSQLPHQIGSWVGTDSEPDPRIIVATGAHAQINRSYRSDANNAIMLHVAAWTESRVGLPHPPQMCYRGAGFQIGDQQNVALHDPDGAPFYVRFFPAEQASGNVLVAYWYQLGKPTFSDRDGLRRALWGFRGQAERPCLMKVLLHTPIDDPDLAKSRLEEFAQQVYQWTKGLQ